MPLRVKIAVVSLNQIYFLLGCLWVTPNLDRSPPLRMMMEVTKEDDYRE